jgi:hypothetical protein
VVVEEVPGNLDYFLSKSFLWWWSGHHPAAILVVVGEIGELLEQQPLMVEAASPFLHAVCEEVDLSIAAAGVAFVEVLRLSSYCHPTQRFPLAAIACWNGHHIIPNTKD